MDWQLNFIQVNFCWDPGTPRYYKLILVLSALIGRLLNIYKINAISIATCLQIYCHFLAFELIYIDVHLMRQSFKYSHFALLRIYIIFSILI